MLSLFSSRRIWDSPTPHPQVSCALTPLWFRKGGAHSLAGKGIGESQFRREDYTVVSGTLFFDPSCKRAPLYLLSSSPALLFPCVNSFYKAGSLKMNTTLEYSTRVVQEGDRRCKKSTLNDLAYLTPLRIPLMNPVIQCVTGGGGGMGLCGEHIHYTGVKVKHMPEVIH